MEVLRSEGEFIYYKDKQDLPPEGSNLANDVFILCLQSTFQKDAYRRLGNTFLGIDTTHNVTQYKGILLFTLMAHNHWGHGKLISNYFEIIIDSQSGKVYRSPGCCHQMAHKRQYSIF